jgi:hypothetical protein
MDSSPTLTITLSLGAGRLRMSFAISRLGRPGLASNTGGTPLLGLLARPFASTPQPRRISSTAGSMRLPSGHIRSSRFSTPA